MAQTDALFKMRELAIRHRLIFVLLLTAALLSACAASLGNTRIAKPDEYNRIFEAREKIILAALAGVFKEKMIGTNVRIDQKKNMVETDYLIQDEWRTKSIARVKKLNWKECEVTLSVITEKKTPQGWELRRLLEKPQFDNLFYYLDLKIFEEMAKIE